MKTAGICAFILASVTAGGAMAQGQATQQMTPEALYKAAQNQLGIVEYCKDKGFATQEDIDSQQSIMKIMQAPADKSGLEEAQVAGKKGVVQSMGQETDVEDYAKTSGKSVEPFCQQITTAIKQAAAQLPK
jgi:protein-tyrosine-phosphatase